MLRARFQSLVIFEDSTGKGRRSSMAVSPFSAQSLSGDANLDFASCLNPGGETVGATKQKPNNRHIDTIYNRKGALAVDKHALMEID